MNIHYPTYTIIRQGNIYTYYVRNFNSVTVLRMDGRLIKKFDYDEMIHSKSYFEKWCEDNYFNVEIIDQNFMDLTIWVS